MALKSAGQPMQTIPHPARGNEFPSRSRLGMEIDSEGTYSPVFASGFRILARGEISGTELALRLRKEGFKDVTQLSRRFDCHPTSITLLIRNDPSLAVKVHCGRGHYYLIPPENMGLLAVAREREYDYDAFVQRIDPAARYNVKQLAELLGIGRKAVYRFLKEGMNYGPGGLRRNPRVITGLDAILFFRSRNRNLAVSTQKIDPAAKYSVTGLARLLKIERDAVYRFLREGTRFKPGCRSRSNVITGSDAISFFQKETAAFDAFIKKIDAAAECTVKELAGLVGMRPNSIYKFSKKGLIFKPSSRMRLLKDPDLKPGRTRISGVIKGDDAIAFFQLRKNLVSLPEASRLSGVGYCKLRKLAEYGELETKKIPGKNNPFIDVNRLGELHGLWRKRLEKEREELQEQARLRTMRRLAKYVEKGGRLSSTDIWAKDFALRGAIYRDFKTLEKAVKATQSYLERTGKAEKAGLFSRFKGKPAPEVRAFFEEYVGDENAGDMIKGLRGEKIRFAFNSLNEIRRMISDYSESGSKPGAFVRDALPKILEKSKTTKRMWEWQKELKEAVADYGRNYGRPFNYGVFFALLLRDCKSVRELRQARGMAADYGKNHGDQLEYVIIVLPRLLKKQISAGRRREWDREMKSMIACYRKDYGDPDAYIVGVLLPLLNKCETIKELRQWSEEADKWIRRQSTQCEDVSIPVRQSLFRVLKECKSLKELRSKLHAKNEPIAS